MAAAAAAVAVPSYLGTDMALGLWATMTTAALAVVFTAVQVAAAPDRVRLVAKAGRTNYSVHAR